MVFDPVTAFYFGSSGLASGAENQNSSFLYPQISFTKDATLTGFITPMGGTRYSVSLSGSPGLGNDSPLFGSVLGDFRHYFNLGPAYTVAVRGSAGASIGRDSQTYFMGGQLGWINQQWSDNGIPIERLADTFFTLPAVPLRGHEFNAIYGNKFALINTEFRFPLFAAIIPGALPIFPLYNITGAFFFDIGTAWGYDINSGFLDEAGNPVQNSKNLDFKFGETKQGYIVNQNNDLVPVTEYIDGGDLLAGSGFGLRTIVFGLPFRWDMAWAYGKGGFEKNAIHYFSIGIDF